MKDTRMYQARMKQALPLALGAAFLALGCGTSDTIPTAPGYDGAAQLGDLQDYAAIGNSLTAGYQSGAWGNPDHIAASYPNLIARQLGIADFDQVQLTGTGVGFSGSTPVGNMVVDWSTGTPSPVYSAVDMANVAALAAGAPAAFDFTAPRNFGIPGITLMHAAGAPLGVYAAGNPYAALYTNASSAAKTQVQLAAESGASFITCWLGNNDVLGYVLSGGTGSITDAAVFQASLDGALGALGAAAPYLAVMNIPSVTSIPFVTYFNPVLNARLDALGVPHAVYVFDDALGQAVLVSTHHGSNNYLLLPAASAMADSASLGASAATPLPDALVLDAAELAAAQAAVDDFNDRLAAGVAALNAAGRDHDAVLVDMHAFFNDVVAHGHPAYGTVFTTAFLSGGLFSLDGVHPSSLGYAIVANEIIADINWAWGLRVEPVDLDEFIDADSDLGPVAGRPALPDFSTVVELFQH